jgi:hypothetical protein
VIQCIQSGFVSAFPESFRYPGHDFGDSVSVSIAAGQEEKKGGKKGKTAAGRGETDRTVHEAAPSHVAIRRLAEVKGRRMEKQVGIFSG